MKPNKDLFRHKEKIKEFIASRKALQNVKILQTEGK
jgi:hypothetical protein